MTKIKCSILLGTLFIVVAVESASLHKKYVKNIPVRVIYERSNNFNLANARNVDQQPPVAASLPENKNEQKENEKIVEKPNLDSGCNETGNKNLSEKVQLSSDQLRQQVNLVPKIVTPEENNKNGEQKKQQTENKNLSLIDETRRLIDNGINKIRNDVKAYNTIKIDDSKWKDLNASLENNINLLNQKVGTKQDSAPPSEEPAAPAPAPTPTQGPGTVTISAAWESFLQNFQSTTNGFVQNAQQQWQQFQTAGQEFINNCCSGGNGGAVANEENQGNQPPNFFEVVQTGFQNLQTQLQNLQTQFTNAFNNQPTVSTVLGDVDLDEPASPSPVQSAQNFFNQVGTAVQNLNPFRPTVPPAVQGDIQGTSPNPIVSAFQGAGNQIQNFFAGAQNILGGQPSQTTAAPAPVQPQEPAALPERMQLPELAASSESSPAAPQEPTAASLPQEPSSTALPSQTPAQPLVRQQEIPERNATTIQPPSTEAEVQKKETMLASE